MRTFSKGTANPLSKLCKLNVSMATNVSMELNEYCAYSNACPVKEEVVAPYWANNTRGEVLALLNLYPFEQYIHWEKCNGEFKQMFCRDGCRLVF
jgi:hypothetical protein